MKTEQYAALNDLEAIAREILQAGSKKLVLVFDPVLGWCATDEVEAVVTKQGEMATAFRVQCYADWWRPHVGEALSSLVAARFLPGTLVGRLFRKALPGPAVVEGAGQNTAGKGAPAAKVNPK